MIGNQNTEIIIHQMEPPSAESTRALTEPENIPEDVTQNMEVEEVVTRNKKIAGWKYSNIQVGSIHFIHVIYSSELFRIFQPPVLSQAYLGG